MNTKILEGGSEGEGEGKGKSERGRKREKERDEQVRKREIGSWPNETGRELHASLGVSAVCRCELHHTAPNTYMPICG